MGSEKKENLVNFCCEKCSKEFMDFDEWQKHRQTCKRVVETKELNVEESVIFDDVVADFDDDDSSSFDMFKTENEDIDLCVEGKETKKDKENEEAKDELLD